MGEFIFSFLIIFSLLLGAIHMIMLETNPVFNITRSNNILAFLGSTLGFISYKDDGIIGIITSYGFGVCFGLIIINLIFEKNND